MSLSEVLIRVVIHVVQTDVLGERGPMFFLTIPLGLRHTVLLGSVRITDKISFIHRPPIWASISGYDIAILIYFLTIVSST
jgi:hypothetical protein